MSPLVTTSPKVSKDNFIARELQVHAPVDAAAVDAELREAAARAAAPAAGQQ